MTSSGTVTVFAPAKINLTLHVGRPMADGRHPLDSLVAFADVGDTLVVTPTRGGELTLEIDGPFAAALAPEPDNLVLRAARLMQARKDAHAGAHIRLTKALPIASGIGGGSADAAATLRALNGAWDGPRLDDDDLREIAGALGADVPACIASRPVRMLGDGRTLAPFACPQLPAVLINPGAPAPTGAVYRAFDALDLGDAFGSSPEGGWPTPAAAITALGTARNDLEPAAVTVTPSIADVLTALAADPDIALARLSGSGATCFGLAHDAAAAARAAERLATAHMGWWVRRTMLGGVDGGETTA